MPNNIIGLLPCAGSAQRLMGLPKFMLPLKDKKKCLLTNWIDNLIELGCDKIIIGCSPSTLIFMNHMNISSISNKICIKDVGVTETMNETIIKALEDEVYNTVIMAMPDTFVNSFDKLFLGNFIKSKFTVGSYLWNIRKDQLGKIGQCKIENETICDIIDKDETCEYKYGWGIIAFKPQFMEYMSSVHLHPGYSMKKAIENNNIIPYTICKEQYFDCGTIEGYRTYLNYIHNPDPIYIKGTIIVMAVYINNSEKSYDSLISCLKQLRTVYKNKTIVTVDNMSLNKAWHSIAIELGMIVLNNDDAIHKYEFGAYKCALKFFRADKYIFIQGTIFINKKLELDLLVDTMDVIAFNAMDKFYWSDAGKIFIIDLLKSINIPCNGNIGLCCWNSFCCNDLFVNEMIVNGLFELPSYTKNHSCAFERILYIFIKNKFGENYRIKNINNNMFKKILLGQELWTI